MSLERRELNPILDTLLESFRDREELRLFIFHEHGRVYEDLARSSTREAEYLDVLVHANAQGWLPALIGALARQHPTFSRFFPLFDRLPEPALATPPWAISPEAAEAAAAEDRKRSNELQRLVNPNDPSQRAARLMARLESGLARVGGLEVDGNHQGTVFLIGPNKVLTNFHVIERLVDLRGDAITLRFDFDGTGTGPQREGWTTCLASDWLGPYRPPSDVDDVPDSVQPPEATELDYAVLQLLTPIDQERGWFNLAEAAPLPDAGDHVTLLHHPMGAPKEISWGHVTRIGPAERRLRYTANSKRRSSGGAVLNSAAQPVAIHHAGDPNFKRRALYNQGIPLTLIAEDLAAGCSGPSDVRSSEG